MRVKGIFLTAICVLIISLGFSSFILGVEVTGELIPFIGCSQKISNMDFDFIVGMTYDKTFVLYGNARLRYSYMLASFSFIKPFGYEDFLTLVGIGGYYEFNNVLINAVINVTLPFGAVEKIKGPIPFFGIEYYQ